jgi:hypothetical protein
MAAPLPRDPFTCVEFRDAYSDFRDGDDPFIQAACAAHLRRCPSCAAHDRVLRFAVRILRESRGSEPPTR